MQKRNRTACGLVLSSAVLSIVLTAALPLAAQTANPAHAIGSDPSAVSRNDSQTQEQLLKLLRLSPTLTMVVARDPSLLADQEYVSRNSPELAQFLQAHPEVVRNPSFYLFSRLDVDSGEGGRHRDEALERKIWPDITPQPQMRSDAAMDLGASAAFLCIMGTLIWLIRMLLENVRWSRTFKQQSEVHAKLIDRFGNNQELLTYMETEAGKHFLEAAPIPVSIQRAHNHLPGPLARVLLPLQIGVVLTLLGIGLLLLRYGVADLATPLLIAGVVVLMPGLGFILSAGITWFLAARLGLISHSTGNA